MVSGTLGKGDSFNLSNPAPEVYEFFGRDVYVPKEHVFFFFFCTQEAFGFYRFTL